MRECGAEVKHDAPGRPLSDWLGGGHIDAQLLEGFLPDEARGDPLLLTELIEDAQYAPYLARQEAELRDLRASEQLRLPSDFPFGEVPGLSNEMVERLTAAHPSDLSAASRVPGITPAALAALLVHARRREGLAA